MVGLNYSAYESARKQRIEENKKRLQELGIKDISESFAKCKNLLLISPSKSSPLRQSKGSGNNSNDRTLSKEKVKVQLRRSARNSGNPLPQYREVEVEVRRRARFESSGGRHYSRLYERKYATEESRLRATRKAEAIKEGLPLSRPSFVKPMLQSHVTGGFWLGFPVAFCRDHMPKKDERIVLVDEKDEEWETLYLSNKTGLSGGWRGFSLDHGLVDGDALVFELVQPHRFKVHIVRASEAHPEDPQECPSAPVHPDTKLEQKNELPSDLSKQQQCSTKLLQRQKQTGGTEVLKNGESDVILLITDEKSENPSNASAEKMIAMVEMPEVLSRENAENKASIVEITEDLPNGSAENEVYRVEISKYVCHGNAENEAFKKEARGIDEAITEIPEAPVDMECNTISRKRKTLEDSSHVNNHRQESKKMKNMASYLRSRKQRVVGKK